MKEERILGNNIQLLLKQNNIDKYNVASELGYSGDDFVRICEGRVFLPMDQIGNIAEYFQTSITDLLARKTDDEYQNAGCIHYNHSFKKQENLDTIMELFDLICDVEEAI